MPSALTALCALTQVAEKSKKIFNKYNNKSFEIFPLVTLQDLFELTKKNS